jgi:hypothetical protein
VAEYYKLEFMLNREPYCLLAEGLKLGDSERPGTKTFEFHRIVAEDVVYNSFMEVFGNLELVRKQYIRVEPLNDSRPPFILYTPCLTSVGLQVRSSNVRIAEHVCGQFRESQ